MDLFDQNPDTRHAPLAERLRAERLEQVVGQPGITAEDGLLHRLLKLQKVESMIFWGPPGCGKTTVARMLIRQSGLLYYSLNAVTSGVAELRKVIAQARDSRRLQGRGTILFIDEIHRFNKAQQDALLGSVEDGTLTLVGATTENPGFEIIRALLSRCHVIQFEALEDSALLTLIDRALQEDEWITGLGIELPAASRERLVGLAGGDARKLLQLLEMAAGVAADLPPGKRVVDAAVLERLLANRILPMDRKGDMHYDMVSAFIKSIRGSDADAGIYWLARMLEAGEDPVFVARRLLILASEDVGNASPNALVIAQAAFQAVHALGMPEAMYPLAQCTTYLAAQPKSNRAGMAYHEARQAVRAGDSPAVPLHLRNAPTALAKKLGHGKDYRYPHDHPGAHVAQQYLPDGLEQRVFYRPADRGIEARLREYLAACWPDRGLGEKE